MAERKAFLLRIDPQLWAELEGWAGSELRSVNGQIEYLLREAVARRKGRGVRGGSGSRRSAGGSAAGGAGEGTEPDPAG